MGEYARFGKHEVKIGTCQSMYYLRADQRHLVRHTAGNVDPNGEDRFSIRFRFPWPDEDGVEPGAFDPYDRSVCIPGVPASVEHYSVQFSARPGYLLSIPCPEGPGPHALTVHRNGWRGAVLLAYQKMLRDGRTVPVLSCGGCEALWRVEDPTEIAALVVACRSEADRKLSGVNDPPDAHRVQWWHTIADRMAAGAGLLADVA